MAGLALVIAILALAIGAVAYWRSGGQQDVAFARRKLEEQIDTLLAKQRDLADSASTATRIAYERLQERMRRTGARLAELRKDVSESLEMQIDRATREVKELQRLVAEGIKGIKDSTITAARETEEALAKRVHRLEAQVDVLEAKFEMNRALARAEKREFDAAEDHLREAVLLVKDARRVLGDDDAYDAKLDIIADSLRQTVAAVKARAADLQSRIERVVTQSDTLISTLESDEQAAELVTR